jgi:hypothetical protein
MVETKWSAVATAANSFQNILIFHEAKELGLFTRS